MQGPLFDRGTSLYLPLKMCLLYYLLPIPLQYLFEITRQFQLRKKWTSFWMSYHLFSCLLIHINQFSQDMEGDTVLNHTLFNVELPHTKAEGFTSVYRKKGQEKLTDTPEESVKTLRDLLKLTSQRYGERNGIGEIKVSKEKDEHGKDIQKRTLTQHTYHQAYDLSYNLGRYVYGKGLYFTESERNMKLVGIYSKNRYEWFITDWAFAHFGLTNVPLYDTLGIDNLTFVLNQTGITTIFVSSSTVKVLLQLKDIGKLRTIISFDKLDQHAHELISSHNLELLYFQDIVQEGKQLSQINNDGITISSEDCSTFSYTSGTTGPPKGVMISHKNILSCVSGYYFHPDLSWKSEDRYLSYLPLPHLMERSLSFFLFYVGANVIVSSGNHQKLKEDCEIAKITVLISVPRVFSRIAESIKNKFTEMGLPTFHHPGIFAKVRESFGGCIRFLGTGSAPINLEVLSYLRDVFQCPFVEGYGLTQCTAGMVFSRSTDPILGNLSELSSPVEIKLCDIPEMKYTSKDVDEHGNPTPRGQLWARGPAVFIGYYKQPQLTRQCLDEDGWLRTGDVIQINPESNGLRIIDRRKNIFKLAQGQYLAPDRIENVYTQNTLISEAFLHGDPQQHYAVAVITPNREVLEKLAEKANIKGTYEQICAHTLTKKLVLAEISNTGKKEGLNGFEIAKNIFLEPQGFIFKGILTNTMKLIRYEARKVYKSEIEQLYLEGEISLK